MIDVGDVKLHCVEAGAGPLVVLLHGFPEFWYSWRYQIPALAKAGFHVLVPDMRGYNLSGKPAGVENYAIDKLTGDVARLIESVGQSKAHVVGHDWGGAVAWAFAMRQPKLLDKLVICNCPHPFRFLKALRTFRQLRKSWYMFFFQLPKLPEAMFRAGDYRSIRKTFTKDPVRAGAFSPQDVERYVEAVSQPGALTTMIHYYRAMFRSKPDEVKREARPIENPVLAIFGEQDRYIGTELAEPDAKWVPHCRVERIADASHWVQVDQPERVNELMISFLKH
jgi:pimeloyl-ACP methyl ester carboxylesterase